MNAARRALAPTGRLRAGINMRNPLLVSGRDEDGGPVGVAADVARELARILDVPVSFVPFDSPAAVADAVDLDAWDVGLIGAEPQRAQHITFSDAYVQADACYLVRTESDLATNADVDSPGIRVSVAERTAYELWLSRNLTQAEVHRAATPRQAMERFRDDGLEAMADLKQRLVGPAGQAPDLRLIDEPFTAVEQAVGTPRSNLHAAQVVRDLIAGIAASGYVSRSIAHHGVVGLSVPPVLVCASPDGVDPGLDLARRRSRSSS